MAEGEEEVDAFKEEFKRYKKKSCDMKDFIDFRDKTRCEKLIKVGLRESSETNKRKAECLGLKPPSKWSMFSLPNIPGLLVLPDLFQSGSQHYWVRRCLVDYPCKPNVCNLDAHMQRTGDGSLWSYIHSTCPDDLESTGAKRARLDVKNKADKDWKSTPLYRLRWVTLGYHYNWNTKEYSSELKSPFPADLSALSSCIFEHAGFPGFKAEAAIVNYYHLDSSLSGHTDHSEKDLEQPLLSISFGQSAIFLIGGKSKQVKPVALLLRSGDVVIMSGSARLAYHGVPRILPPSSSEMIPCCLSAGCITHGLCHWHEPVNNGDHKTGKSVQDCPHCLELTSHWDSFESYLSVSRINVNVRQVVSEKHTF